MNGTVAELLDLLYTGEKSTERFYMGLAEMFLHEPVAAGVWWEMAAEEALHMWLIEKAREALTPEQLATPVAPEMLEAARTRAAFSPEKLWASIQTLEDAYQAAHEVEGLEFDAILEPIMLDFFPNDIRNRLARSQLHQHQQPLGQLRTREWRLAIERRSRK
ncbi:MAG: hypothetical protein ACPLYD_14255 [Anaerolineae bacterium]